MLVLLAYTPPSASMVTILLWLLCLVLRAFFLLVHLMDLWLLFLPLSVFSLEFPKKRCVCYYGSYRVSQFSALVIVFQIFPSSPVVPWIYLPQKNDSGNKKYGSGKWHTKYFPRICLISKVNFSYFSWYQNLFLPSSSSDHKPFSYLYTHSLAFGICVTIVKKCWAIIYKQWYLFILIILNLLSVTAPLTNCVCGEITGCLLTTNLTRVVVAITVISALAITFRWANTRIFLVLSI